MKLHERLPPSMQIFCFNHALQYLSGICKSRADLSWVVLKTEPSKKEVYRSRVLGLSLDFISVAGFAVFKQIFKFLVDMQFFSLFTKWAFIWATLYICFKVNVRTTAKNCISTTKNCKSDNWYEIGTQTQTSVKDTLSEKINHHLQVQQEISNIFEEFQPILKSDLSSFFIQV